ncbi:MAG: HEAT repeat domain-containing protein [Deltaproteobacteria bacterium]|nr:HEAT repeat domain-containing protein [Deltaproteobacteria bacterium]
MEKLKKVVVVLVILVLLFILYLLFTPSDNFTPPKPYFPEKDVSSSSVVSSSVASLPSSVAAVQTISSSEQVAGALSSPESLSQSSAASAMATADIYKTFAADAPFLNPLTNSDNQNMNSSASAISANIPAGKKALMDILAKDSIEHEEAVRYLFPKDAEEKLLDGYSHEQVIELLMDQLASNDEYKANEAAVLLFRVIRDVDAEQLANIVQKGGFNDFSQSTLVKVLGKLKDRRVFKTLYDEFRRSSNTEVRDAIIVALGYLGDERAIPLLLSVVNTYGKKEALLNSYDSYGLALSALTRIGTPKALKGLEQGLDDLLVTNVARLYRYSVDTLRKKQDRESIDEVFIPGQAKIVANYKGTKYLLYIPTRRADDKNRPRLMVCIHGNDFAYDQLFDTCQRIARNYKFGVLVPIFDLYTFPYYHKFNLMEYRSDKRFFEILELLKTKGGIDTREMYFYGVGTGGEFVYNFTLAYPERVGRAMIDTNNVESPDVKHLFPTGVGATPWAPDIEINRKNFIKSDLALLYFNDKDLTVRNEIASFRQHYDYADYLGVTPRLALRRPRRNAVTAEQKEEMIEDLIESYIFKGL